MKILTLTSVIAVLCLHLNAQTAPTALRMGAPVPDITIKGVVNHSTPNITLASLKGQLVILNFFATWCGACIKELPALEALQKKYAGKLKVLIVATDTMRDDRKKVTAFLKKWEKQTGHPFSLTYLYAADNPLLKEWFPHHILPHNVWINAQGAVLQITGSSYINEAYVQAALENEKIQALTKVDLQDINKWKPLSTGQTQDVENSVLYRSGFYKHMGLGTSTSIIKDSLAHTITYRWLNHTLLQFLQKSMPGLSTGFKRSFLLEVKDSIRLLEDSRPRAEWRHKYSYSYELSVSDTVKREQVNAWMLEDINRFFNLNARNEKCFTTVWELYLTDSLKLLSRSGKAFDSLDINSKYLKLCKGTPRRLQQFLQNYTFTSPMVPIIDSTGISRPIDIEITVPQNASLAQLQKLLQPYGIGVRAIQKEMMLHLISDK